MEFSDWPTSHSWPGTPGSSWQERAGYLKNATGISRK